jgi:uncharacterized protein (TIGR02246 family)
MGERQDASNDEDAIRRLIESWAAAVRNRDYDGILADHAPDLVMFDVPPPLQSQGLEAYRKTWDLFFSWSSDPIPYDIHELSVTAGADVAFAVATLGCAEPGPDGGQKALDFRLTVGLRKVAGRWLVTHEHHSIPAVD